MRKQTEQQIVVSIVFSNYNGGNEPIECLRSIGKLNFPKNSLEVIVIDNGSKDGSKEKIKKFFPKTKMIRLKKEIGLPASLNLGINKSKGKYIMIANDDIVFEKNSIKTMVNFLEKNAQVGILGGKVFYKEEPKKLSLSACDFNMYKGEIKGGLAKGKNIKWLQSCAIMIPRAVFESIGLFDSGYYPLYFDDFDFCLRATKANLKIIYLKNAIFWHGGGKTTQKFPDKNVYYWWYKNKIRFYIKHASILQIIPAFIVQLSATTVKSMSTKQNLIPCLFKAFAINFAQLPAIISSKKKHAQIKQR